MRFVLREKFLAFGEDFYIQDEHGNNVLFVDGKVFSIGDKLSIQDLRGNEVAAVRQRLIALRPTYEIIRDGQHAATINKALFTVFGDRFKIDVPGPDDLEVRGDIWQHEYAITRGGQPVAYVSKRWFSLRETYGVDVADNEDAILMLATVVVIDVIADHEERQRQQHD